MTERDFKAEPYTADERRVCDYIAGVTDGAVGCGDDPIGFLIAAHRYMAGNGSRAGSQNAIIEIMQHMERQQSIIATLAAGLTCLAMPGAPEGAAAKDIALRTMMKAGLIRDPIPAPDATTPEAAPPAK